MAKRLILMRHAKSSWCNDDLDDSDRPLNVRGERSARALGDWLRARDYLPGEALISTARRTRDTFAELQINTQTHYLPELYLAGAETILTALRAAQAETVLLIGHNPGIGDLASRIVTDAPRTLQFVKYPTGATLVVDVETGSWPGADFGLGRIVDFITPRELTG